MNDNGCPTETGLIEFALSPLQEENIDMLMHILHCKTCGRKLHQINKVLLADCEVSSEEWEEIKRFRPHAKGEAEALWRKVERLLTRIVLDNPVIPFDLEEVPAAAASGKNLPHEKAKIGGAAASFVDLTFKANCDERSKFYWTATLRIDLSVEDETILPVSITDGSGAAVTGGKLILCGQTLSVADGKAGITLEDFRRGLRSREIAFDFATGERMAGCLVLALEDMIK